MTRPFRIKIAVAEEPYVVQYRWLFFWFTVAARPTLEKAISLVGQLASAYARRGEVVYRG